MSSYKAAVYPEPDRRDTAKMKEFFNLKYKNFFTVPSDMRETDNEEFKNSSDYQMHLKNEEEINILRNFGYLTNYITI